MTYTTLLVNLNPGHSNSKTLAVTQRLAETFNAVVIGIAGGHPSQSVYANSFAGDDVYAPERKATERMLREAHEEFMGVFPLSVHNTGWRETGKLEPISEFVAREARSADLVITGVPEAGFPDFVPAARPPDVIMQAGRPVLVVPASCADIDLNRVLVAWKDTREARRAVADAVPMLQRALQLQLVEIADAKDKDTAKARLDDLAAWLARHKVRASVTVALANPDDPDQLGAIATELGATLVVAGAYGHSRLQQWMMGGVTRNLLEGVQRCSLVSH